MSSFSDESTDLLVKPNAGGFGAGIQKIESVSSTTSGMLSIPKPSFDDGMALIQQYAKAKDEKLYRVWFLNGKIQCAVERTMSKNNSSSDEFTSGCAAGICTLSAAAGIQSKNKTNDQGLLEYTNNMTMAAWSVPLDVQEELEHQLFPLLLDAHCGSVEFLYSQNDEISNGEDHCRLYFDLNLLSTLPIIDDSHGSTLNEKGVWPHDYDPWLELANAMRDYFLDA
jgi:hypothetical protein